MITSRLSLTAVAVATAIASHAVLAQEAGTYAADLSRVYEAAQFIRAVKEGCDAAEPDTRAPNDAAYTAWRKRHQSLLNELERRFTAMIRRASTDSRDYAVNVGKYAGQVLEHLEEMKKEFLAQGAQQVTQQCRDFPGYLKSEDADLRKRYAAELKAIRKRKL
jgi:hypothetical protein